VRQRKSGPCPPVPIPRERDSGTTSPKAGQNQGHQRDTIPAGPYRAGHFDACEGGHSAGQPRDRAVPEKRNDNSRLGHHELAPTSGRPAMSLPAGSLPRGLSRVQAAEYIGVGATTFDQMVSDGCMPKPKRIGRRVVWDRHQLDLAFFALPDENDRDDIWARVAV
jgi:hypothetical protein